MIDSKTDGDLKPDFIHAKYFCEVLQNLSDYAKEKGITRRYEEMINDIYNGFATPFILPYIKKWNEADSDRAEQGMGEKERNEIIRRRALKKRRIIGNIIANNGWIYNGQTKGIKGLLADLTSHYLMNLNDEIFDDGMAKEYEDVEDDIYWGWGSKFITKKNKDDWNKYINIIPGKHDNKEESIKIILNRLMLKRHCIADIIADNGWLFKKIKIGIKELIDEAKEGQEREDYFDEVAELAAKWLEQDTDLVAVFSGHEGNGKSTAAFDFGKRISKYTGQKFGINNFVWDGEELIRKIKEFPPFSVIIYDEAILGLYKMSGMSQLNVMIKKALSICREYNKIIILNIPNLFDVEKFARERRVKLWFNIKVERKGYEIKRGKATIRSNLDSPEFGGEPYWKPEGDIGFKDMTKAIKKNYKQVKRETTYALIMEDSKNHNGSTKRDEMKRYLTNKYINKLSNLKNSDAAQCEGMEWDSKEFKTLKRKMGLTNKKKK